MDSKTYSERALTRDLPIHGYEKLKERITPEILRLTHAAIGMAGEAGEVADIVKKGLMYNKPIDPILLIEECGDVLWYMNVLLHQLGSNFETAMQMNDHKLSKRYPTGFTEQAAITRADKEQK